MPSENQSSVDPKDHLLPPHPGRAGKPSSGPFFGIVIILALLLLGGWYFWNESQRENPVDPLPLIPPENSSQQG